MKLGRKQICGLEKATNKRRATGAIKVPGSPWPPRVHSLKEAPRMPRNNRTGKVVRAATRRRSRGWDLAPPPDCSG